MSCLCFFHFVSTAVFHSNFSKLRRLICQWIIIGSDRQPETKQGIEGKIGRFRSGRVRVRERVRVRFRSPI